VSVDKRIAALALTLSVFVLAFAGLMMIVFAAPSGSFDFQKNLLGFIFALMIIAAGVAYYFQASRA